MDAISGRALFLAMRVLPLVGSPHPVHTALTLEKRWDIQTDIQTPVRCFTLSSVDSASVINSFSGFRLVRLLKGVEKWRYDTKMLLISYKPRKTETKLTVQDTKTAFARYNRLYRVYTA